MVNLIAFRRDIADLPDRLNTVVDVAVYSHQQDPTIVDRRFMHLIHAVQQMAPTDLTGRHRLSAEIMRLVMHNDEVATRLAALMALGTRAKYGHDGYFPTIAELQAGPA